MQPNIYDLEFFKELGFVGRYIDQDTRMKHSSKDFSAIIKIKETERYWIQHNLFYLKKEQEPAAEPTSQQTKVGKNSFIPFEAL